MYGTCVLNMNLDYGHGGLSKLLLFRGEKQPRDDFKILVDLKGTKKQFWGMGCQCIFQVN